MPATTIAAGAFTWTLNSSVGTSDRVRTVCAGPVMSNFIYRKPVAGNNWLVLWADVRVFKGGDVEIFPWVESAVLTTAVNADTRTYTVTIGGAQRMSASINVKGLTRVPLLPNNSQTFSYWTGTDPQITPKHDRAYLMATKLVPNYIGLDPTSTVLNSLPQNYIINDATGGGQVSTTMSEAGGRGSAFDSGTAMYLKSGGDPRGYRAMIANALSSGAWSSHHRDQTTFNPIKFSDYPNVQIDAGQGTPVVQHETNIAGGRNGLSSFTHLPSYGYGPFLMTGRWWFFEEVLMWTTSSYIYTTVSRKQGANHIIDPNNGYFDRGAAWAMTSLWQSLALCPSDYPLFNDLKNAVEANMAHYRAKYVDGTSFSGAWVNPQGWFAVSTQYNAGGEPASNDRRAAAWQDAYLKLTLALARSASLPISAGAQANLVAVTDKGYQGVIARAGDGAGGNPNWRHLTVYDYPIANPWGSTPPGGWLTANQSYASWRAFNGVAALPATPGLSLKAADGTTDLSSGSGSIVYFDVCHDILALATEQGVPGAAASFARVQSASNYQAIRDNYFRGGEHPWGWAGMGPRS